MLFLTQAINSLLLKIGRTAIKAARKIDPAPKSTIMPAPINEKPHLNALKSSNFSNSIFVRDYSWTLQIEGIIPEVAVSSIDPFTIDYNNETSAFQLAFNVMSLVQKKEDIQTNVLANLHRWAKSKEKHDITLAFYSVIGDKIQEIVFNSAQVSSLNFPVLAYSSNNVVINIKVVVNVLDGISLKA